jgi:HUS1 checkpoint protein
VVFKSGRGSFFLSSLLLRDFQQKFRKIRVDALFTDYRILSHSNNEITLNLPTDALSTALRSASAEHTGANEVVMKLAKKNNLPVLSFEIFGTTHMGRKVKVAHDVRIEVMKPADVALLTEPRCPEPDVLFFTEYRAKEIAQM